MSRAFRRVINPFLRTNIVPCANIVPEGNLLAKVALCRAVSMDATRLGTATSCTNSGDNVKRGWQYWVAMLPFAAIPAVSTSKADPGEPESNHPLDYDPVINEHTARMTLARRAAMDAYNQGRYKEAERRFREAVEAAKQGFGPNDPHVASCLNNLAEFYRNIKNYGKAEPAYKEALQLLHEQYGDNHWLYVSALHNLALMYASKEDMQAARSTMESVLKLRAKMFGSKHITYADSEMSLAGLLLQSGVAADAKRAVELMMHAVFVLEDSGSVEGTPILQWLADLSRVLRQQKRYKEAAQYLRKTLQYMTSLHGELQAQASEVSEQLVAVLLDCADVPGAREVMQRSTEARMQLYGRDLTVARSLTNLATLWLQSGTEGELVVAENFASSAVSICTDLWQQANRKGVMHMFSNQLDPTRALSRLQAAAELSNALSCQARICSRLKQSVAAVTCLRQACDCLQQQLQQVQSVVDQLSVKDQAVAEKLVTKFVEAKLQLLDALEKLASELKQVAGSDTEEIQSIQQQANALAQELLGN